MQLVKVLMLGGTGLIGTGITRQLLAAGHDVTHLNRGQSSNEFEGHVRLVRGDRNSVADLDRAVAESGTTAVIDMIGFTAEQAELTARVFAGRIEQMVFCSTVDVHTKVGQGFPLDESSPRRPSPAFPYAFAKRQAEQVLEDAAAAGAFSLTVLRPAATYADTAVAPIGSFAVNVSRIRLGLPIVVHGDGSSLWASCHRDDVAAAFVAAVERPVARNRSYIVASNELMTWDTYWRLVARAAADREPEIVHVPTDLLYAHDPDLAEWCQINFRHPNVFDCAAARRDLGFRVTTSFAGGLASMDWSAVPPPDPDLAVRYDRLVADWTAATAGFAATRPRDSVLTGETCPA